MTNKKDESATVPSSAPIDISEFVSDAVETVRAALNRAEQAVAAAEAAKASAQEHQAQAAALVIELQARQSDVAGVVTAASAAQTQIAALQAVIAEKSAYKRAIRRGCTMMSGALTVVLQYS